MNIGEFGSSNATSPAVLGAQSKPTAPPKLGAKDDDATREAFDAFVGETFFGQMLESMRKTLGKPAYFHGGQAEEIFQGQLDQVLSEKMSAAGAESFTGPMYELFMMGRPN